MSKISGHGGYLVVNPVVGGSDGDNVVQHAAEYELEIETDTEEANTPSGANWAEGLPIINRVRSLRLLVCEDDASYPEVAGLAAGGTVPRIWLKRGELAQYDLIEDAEVVRYRKTNTSTTARRVEVMLERGRYTHEVTAPTLP